MSGIFDPAIFDRAIFDEGAAVVVGSGPGFHFIDDGKGRERVRLRRRDAEELREEINALVAGRPLEERTVERVMALPALVETQRRYPHAEIAEMRAAIAEILAAIQADEEDEEEAVVMLLAA